MDSIKNITTIQEAEEQYATITINNKDDEKEFLPKDAEFNRIEELYDECLTFLKQESVNDEITDSIDPDYESIEERQENDVRNAENEEFDMNHKENLDAVNNEIKHKMVYKVENELISNESINSCPSEPRSERLRKLSQQLPKIIITQSNTSLNDRRLDDVKFGTNYNFKHDTKRNAHKSLPKIDLKYEFLKTNSKINECKHRSDGKIDKYELIEKELNVKNSFGNEKKKSHSSDNNSKISPRRPGEVDSPRRLVSKRGIENVAVISNVPFERIRLLNDTFHTLINLRWRWIVTGTIVVHFAIWLVFAVFWYIAALAHYDFEPDPPKRTCVTGGHDFLTIFLASVEAQTTIGFGDRAIDEECPESIFLFIMQLILGTGLSGVLTCVVYAKLTRPEKLSRDGVGFSRKAVISTRDGRLCLMMRAWDLNYDHIISSEFTAHFVHTHRTKEGEIIRYYAKSLALQQRQFLLWPVTLLHVIDQTSPLYGYGPELMANSNYEITVSLKGASASMGTFTQSQTSYLPREVLWGHRFPPVVKYDARKQKYVIEHKKLDVTERVHTPPCSAQELACSATKRSSTEKAEVLQRPATPSSFSEKISSFQINRSSSFKKTTVKYS